MTAREWDAATYDRIADPMARWGRDVLGRLRVAEDAVVLDAGCGSGRVTELLLAKVPSGRVVALDRSVNMLEQAAARLAVSRAWGRLDLVAADLARPLPLRRAFDAVVSTATFHWVADHDRLFANLAAVLRAGAPLVAQCGGAGNVASAQAAAAEVGDGWAGPWHFPTPEEASGRLEAAGFDVAAAWTEEHLVGFDSAEALEEYLATVVLHDHLPRLPAAERAAFVRAVRERMPALALDYVRLNLVATRR